MSQCKYDSNQRANYHMKNPNEQLDIAKAVREGDGDIGKIPNRFVFWGAVFLFLRATQR